MKPIDFFVKLLLLYKEKIPFDPSFPKFMFYADEYINSLAKAEQLDMLKEAKVKKIADYRV